VEHCANAPPYGSKIVHPFRMTTTQGLTMAPLSHQQTLSQNYTYQSCKATFKPVLAGYLSFDPVVNPVIK